MASGVERRDFVEAVAAAAAFTIVPRRVLGGQGNVAPSDKLTMAHIGCGTEGTRELVTGLLQDPRIQIVSCCDVVKDGTDYLDWSKNGTRDTIRRVLEAPSYGEGVPGVRSGRDQFQQVVQTYYAKQKGYENYKGCSAYADFRELLEKEKDLDAVKIMTPDHLHAAICHRGDEEGQARPGAQAPGQPDDRERLVIETARKTKVATHLLAYGQAGPATR